METPDGDPVYIDLPYIQCNASMLWAPGNADIQSAPDNARENGKGFELAGV